MTHIRRSNSKSKILAILGQACARLGLKLIRAKKTFKWYGQEDATCDHAIRVPGATMKSVSSRNGSFELNCDFYDRNLERVIGKNGGLLKQAYAVEKTKIEARQKGYSVTGAENTTTVSASRCG